MDANLEKMLNRVRGLLALAEDPHATPAESELATVRAAELMAKYSIDAAMLAAAADVTEVPCDKLVHFPDPYARQHMFLYVAILRAFGGDAVVVSHHRRGYRSGANNGLQLRVYGFEADLMAVDILYTSLLLQGVNQSKVVPMWENARSWRVSFWVGFTSTISGRLSETHKKVEQAGTPGTDIVLRDRKALVDQRKAADYPKLSQYGGSSARSESGYKSGQAAGERANLHNKGNVTPTRRTALA
jgi:hypothetical protein